MTDELFYFNGINAATGDPLLPPLTARQIAQIARGETFDPNHLFELKERWKVASKQHMGLKAGKDPKQLEEAGWGVIFANQYSDQSGYIAEELRDALAPLLDHRKQQATQNQKNPRYYQEYIGSKAYLPGETKQDFLNRQRVGPGPADPEKMPYYLLIVGDPESIPYQFQYQLDVQRAVGRLYFEKLEDYARYAVNVVTAETRQLSLPRTMTFFGTRHRNDKATMLSADSLIAPLSNWVTKEQEEIADEHQWSVQTYVKNEATKDQLSQILSGTDTPALLFTASHGACFPSEPDRQIRHQGALICQNWSGLGEVKEEFYFSADDLGQDVDLSGRIIFNFACYGAGTPKFNDFAQSMGLASETAPYAFVAQLPQRLLRQGALAVIGHVDLAKGWSIIWSRQIEQIETFQSWLKRLMNGDRIGFAFEFFNERYAELSTDLNESKDSADDATIAKIWTASRDARNYMILGDPAVRLVAGSAHNPMKKPREKIVLPFSDQPATLDRLQQITEDLAKQVKALQEQVNRLEQQIDRSQQNS